MIKVSNELTKISDTYTRILIAFISFCHTLSVYIRYELDFFVQKFLVHKYLTGKQLILFIGIILVSAFKYVPLKKKIFSYVTLFLFFPLWYWKWNSSFAYVSQYVTMFWLRSYRFFPRPIVLFYIIFYLFYFSKLVNPSVISL